MAGQSTSYQKSTEFQEELNALCDGEELELNSFEYPGPVVIKSAVTIDGHGATLWAMEGPVCVIASDGVTIKDLKIFVTNKEAANTDGDKGCALRVEGGRNIQFENVEVLGTVQGLLVEEGQWRYPSTIELRNLECKRQHKFLLRVFVPVPCNISSGIQGISITPSNLIPGKNEITLKVEVPIQDTLLYGTLCLKSAFLKRQIMVTGSIIQAQSGNSDVAYADGSILYEPSDWAQISLSGRSSETSMPVTPPPVTITLDPPPVYPKTQVEPPLTITLNPPPVHPQTQVEPPQAPKEAQGSTVQTNGPFIKPQLQRIRRGGSISPLFGEQVPQPVHTNGGVFEPTRVNLSTVFDSQQHSDVTNASKKDENPESLRGTQDTSFFESGTKTENVFSKNTKRIDDGIPNSSASATMPKKPVSGRNKSIPISGIFGFPQEKKEEVEKSEDKSDTFGTMSNTPKKASNPVKKKGTSIKSKKGIPPIFNE